MARPERGWERRERPDEPFDATTTWAATWSLLAAERKRLTRLIVGLAIVCGMLGGMAKAVLPKTYSATAQIMIDPRGFQVFSNDLTTGQYDANAAVNYVESQMHVMLSERVLARAVRQTTARADAAPAGVSQQDVSQRMLDSVRRTLSVTRAERSYILDVTARGTDPVEAAALANAVVQAYLEEDADSRAAAAQRLTGDLTARLDQLRTRLAESEARAEDFRVANNLVSAGDQLIVDQQLASAVTALGVAEEQLSTVRARVEQLQGSDRNVTAAMASASDQALLNTLISRQVAVREEIARLATRFGNRHPTLRSARDQSAEVDALVNAELSRIRNSGQGALRQATEERDNLAATVARLTEETARIRHFSIELRTLEQQIESDRALLASFETRAREAAEFGKIDSANVRLLSVAYPPTPLTALSGVLAWTIAGAIVGLLAGLAFAALRALAAPENVAPVEETLPRPREPAATTGKISRQRLQERLEARYGGNVSSLYVK